MYYRQLNNMKCTVLCYSRFHEFPRNCITQTVYALLLLLLLCLIIRRRGTSKGSCGTKIRTKCGRDVYIAPFVARADFRYAATFTIRCYKRVVLLFYFKIYVHFAPRATDRFPATCAPCDRGIKKPTTDTRYSIHSGWRP